MVKAEFYDHVRSKTDVEMKTEVLCRVLCHNIFVLIQSQCELGIEPGALAGWRGEEGEGLKRIADESARLTRNGPN
jgi:hypothetical protein